MCGCVHVSAFACGDWSHRILLVVSCPTWVLRTKSRSSEEQQCSELLSCPQPSWQLSSVNFLVCALAGFTGAFSRVWTVSCFCSRGILRVLLMRIALLLLTPVFLSLCELFLGAGLHSQHPGLSICQLRMMCSLSSEALGAE